MAEIIKTHSEIIETVKDRILAAVKGTGDIAQATVDTITQTLATAIRAPGRVDPAVTAALGDVASGAVHGAAEVGGDLGQPTRGIMLGVLRGSQGEGVQLLDTIRHTAHVAIWDTADVVGDLEAAATGLVAGAIDGAKELGIAIEQAAAAAADGALKAAGQVGSPAVSAVRKAVTKPINGVKVALKEGRWRGPTAIGLTDPDWCGKTPAGSTFKPNGPNTN